MKKISVVLPCYKVEPFLENIYADLTEQTIPEDVEFVFVDDGGSVSQARLLDKLAKKDCRVKVVHKNNGGVSSARNASIEASLGDWIVFADPDDHLKPNHLQRLHNAVSNEEHSIDIGIGGYTQISEDGEQIAELFYNMEALNGKSYLESVLAYRECPEMLFGSVCSKIYRKAFLNENRIRFRTDLRFNEDTCFNIDAFRKANKIAFCKDSGYIYVKYYNSSVCSSYLPSLKENNLFRINQLLDLQKDLGYTEEENKRFKIS